MGDTVLIGDDEKWGTWICPICKEELQDPEAINHTQCSSGHGVSLGIIEDDGSRVVIADEI